MKVLRNNELVDMTPEEEAVFNAERAAASRVTPAMVKAEAQRRIYGRLPQWKQTNMQARESELLRIRLGEMMNADGTFAPSRALTPKETSELKAIRDSWAWVLAVRDASDALEAMTPVPEDYTANERWP